MMLRRKPTAIILTSEDVVAFEKSRRKAAGLVENLDPNTMHSKEAGKTAGMIDPNDELKPLPGDRARIVRTGGASREERIQGR